MNATTSPKLWRPLARRLGVDRAPAPLTQLLRLSSVSPAAAPAAGRSRLLASTAAQASPATPCCWCLCQRPVVANRAAAAPDRLFFSTSTARADRPQPADDPNFTSILDNPPELVRSGRRKSRLGLFVLAVIPVTAFALGTWQVFRLRWKTELLAKSEDRIVREPLRLDPHNVGAALAHTRGETGGEAGGEAGDAAAADFDYRRIVAVGRFRHDQEMLVGPRMLEGHVGSFVVTPLELVDPDDPAGAAAATILVNRGWIARELQPQAVRRQRGGGARALPQGLVQVEGMLRAPWKRNLFTPQNRPDKNEFYFPDVAEMAQLTGSLPVWVEATMEPDLLEVYDMEAKGVPIGKPAEVTLRNNHAQYIFTWYSLSLATTIMLWMVARKPSSDIARRVRLNKNW